MTDEHFALLLAELREQTEQLRQLRVELAEGRPSGDVRLGLLLRAVDAALGAQPTTAAELIRLTEAKLSTRIALRHAIAAICGTAQARTKSLGRFLAAHAGAAADGLRLQRLRGCTYRVCRSETNQSVPGHHWPI